MKYKKRLTDQQKLDLVKEYLTGKFTCAKLGQKYNVCKTSIRSLLRYRNIPIFNDQSKLQRRYTLDESYFDKIDTEAKAYFLGLFYADGCNNITRNTINISLISKDKHILETFQKELRSNRPLQFVEKSKKNPNWQDHFILSINSKKLCDSLNKLGCPQAKTFKLKFPTSEIVPDHLLRHFIRGYFDGDGCFTTYITKSKHNNKIYPSKKYCFSIVSTEDFCISLGELLKEKFGYHFSLYKRHKNRDNNCRTLIFSGKKTLSLLEWLYSDSTIYLERKYNKFITEKTLLS